MTWEDSDIPEGIEARDSFASDGLEPIGGNEFSSSGILHVPGGAIAWRRESHFLWVDDDGY